MEIVQISCVERIYDFAGMNVERDYTVNFLHFVDVAQKRGGESLASLFLVLAAVRKCGKNERYRLCSCLLNGINRDEKRHNMVVHGESDHVFSLVHWNRLVVFRILKNENVLSSDGLKNLGFDFAVGEPGKKRLDLEYRRTIFVNCAAHDQI